MLDDLITAARVLSAYPAAARPGLAYRFVTEAHVAHAYAKRLSFPHPRWGNGSLMARALADPARDLVPTQPDFAALAVMAAEIARFRSRV